ncbi:MAG: hypothetical protein AAB728_02230 [Patescibacteria group bacterium]
MHIRSSVGILIVALFAACSGLVIAVMFLKPEFLPEQSTPQSLPSPSVPAAVETPASSSGFVPEAPAYLPSGLHENGTLYTDTAHGFSLVLPRIVVGFWGGCVAAGESGATVATAFPSHVPVEVVQRGNSTVIGPAYSYSADGNTCVRVTLKEEAAVGQYDGWNIETRAVPSDAAMEAWIKERYGSGCTLGGYEPSFQPGVLDVRIEGDGKEFEESQCVIHSARVFKYVPDRRRAYAWNLGEEPKFWADEQGRAAYDLQMLASFRVE